MSYSALKAMKRKNKSDYPGINKLGPHIPSFSLSSNRFPKGSMEYCALRFIRDDCEDLRFSSMQKYVDLTDSDGKSSPRGKIPLHMQYDIDRLCLETALRRFFLSGSPDDAFDVYYCYIEMFFGGNASGRKMVELLSDFETNSSSLLLEHKDHYTHSVYVFALGMALFNQSKFIMDTYMDYYALKSTREAAHHFIRFWGFTALFHDIGYPFELVFSQVKSFFANEAGGIPYVTYKGIEDYVSPDFSVLKEQLLTQKQKGDLSSIINVSPLVVIAENITDKLYETYKNGSKYCDYLSRNHLHDSFDTYRDFLVSVLEKKAVDPCEFDCNMDHALFSALLMMHNLGALIPPTSIDPCFTDAISAIILHNSLYKFTIRNKKKDEGPSLDISAHPLAYILMFCDEFQCWNRRAFGRNTRKSNYPYRCDLQLSKGRISAHFYFFTHLDTGVYNKLHVSFNGSCRFIDDIKRLLNLTNIAEINVEIEVKEASRNEGSTQYLSNSSYLHLYDFAVSLNAQYLFRDYANPHYFGPVSVLEQEAIKRFDDLSLEYKLSNIAQAKRYGYYLHEIGCFYTDKDTCCRRKNAFTKEELEKLGRFEHQRWVDEKKQMGWRYGSEYLNVASSGECRERMRIHKDLVKYDSLPARTRMNDTRPLNDMMWFLEQKDGVHIYYINN